LLAIIATRDKKTTKNNDDTLVEIINNDRSSVWVCVCIPNRRRNSIGSFWPSIKENVSVFG
jgi:hypothetical protein